MTLTRPHKGPLVLALVAVLALAGCAAEEEEPVESDFGNEEAPEEAVGEEDETPGLGVVASVGAVGLALALRRR